MERIWVYRKLRERCGGNKSSGRNYEHNLEKMPRHDLLAEMVRPPVLCLKQFRDTLIYCSLPERELTAVDTPVKYLSSKLLLRKPSKNKRKYRIPASNPLVAAQ